LTKDAQKGAQLRQWRVAEMVKVSPATLYRVLNKL